MRELTDEQTKAARDVLAERERQQSVEGYSPEDDDGYVCGELALAAASYCCMSLREGDFEILWPARALWPWGADNWKPSTSPRRALVKAGALILAELERIDRRESEENAC